MRSNPVLTIHGTRTGSTEKAIKFKIYKIRDVPFGPVETWFPKSQITKMMTDPNNPQSDYLVVSEWIMLQKKLPSTLQEVQSMSQGNEDQMVDTYEKFTGEKPDEAIYNDMDFDDIPF